MSKTAKQNIKSKVRVVYQNLGGVWYAFADMGNEDIFFGKVPLKAKAKGKTQPKSRSTKSAA